MKSIYVEVRCPFCGNSTHKQSETLLINGFESRFRKALLDGSFFRSTCRICKKESNFLHPLLYVDKEHHFVLLVKLEKDITDKDRELYHDDFMIRKRILCDVTLIAEKIRILEDELDDRVIELIKAKLLLQYRQKGRAIHTITYHDFESVTKTIWFTLIGEEEEIIGIEWSVYLSLKRWLPVDDSVFQLIDSRWANNFFSKKD